MYTESIRTHADDILWACKPGYEEKLRDLLEYFGLQEKLNEGPTHRFCGREIVQFEGMPVKVTCTANIQNILPISFDDSQRSGTDAATKSEKS